MRSVNKMGPMSRHAIITTFSLLQNYYREDITIDSETWTQDEIACWCRITMGLMASARPHVAACSCMRCSGLFVCACVCVCVRVCVCVCVYVCVCVCVC